MTNVNGVNYAQQAVPVAQQQIYAQQAIPQYITTPYPNDTFVSSKQEKKSNHTAGKLLLTAAAVVGGAVIARKTGLKNYTKITENATWKQKLANVAVTVADKSTEYGAKGVNYGKKGIAKAKEAVNKLIANFGKKGAKAAETAKEVKIAGYLPTPEQALQTQLKCPNVTKLADGSITFS